MISETKIITFRPLRRIKKTGKVTVASYMQWRKVKTADYNKFNLIVDDEYKKFPSDEFVYDHNGEQLFFFTYNPAEIPVFPYSVLMDLDVIREENVRYGIRWSPEGGVNYNARGMDCDGVPTFSHIDANHASDYQDIEQFEPLTVGMVVKWFGWFLFELENSSLQIGKP